MKILSLQGGGCLGKGQAAILPTIEQLAGKPIALAFDLIVGTSVGSFNGGMAAAGIPTLTINSFFDKYAPDIFKPNPWWRLAVSRLFRSAKYSPDALESALKEILGDRELSDCKTNFLATAVDMTTGRNVYFQSYGKSFEDQDEIILGPDSDIKLWEVLRSSSAAQAYFPGYKWKGFTFWDGGSTGSNAPDMLGVTEGKTNFYSSEYFNTTKMLSLGAGRKVWPYIGVDMSNPNLRTLLEATVEMVYACAENTSVWQAKNMLATGNHLRINPNLLSDFAIDDASPETLGKIASIWVTAAQMNSDLSNFFK